MLSGYLQQDAPCSADNLGITRCDVVCPFNRYSVRLTCSPEGLWKTPDGTIFDATASSAQCEGKLILYVPKVGNFLMVKIRPDHLKLDRRVLHT